MHFELKDFQLFLQVAQTGNLTQAAAQVHLSLAATSARVKAMEAQTGQTLLIRQARGVCLTPAGETFLFHARAMLQQAQRMQAELDEFGAGLRGLLRVFANTTAVADFLPDILAAYLLEYPQVSVDLQERPNAEIAKDIREGRADLGIIAGEVDRQGLQCLPFATDRLVLLTPADSLWAARSSCRFAEVLHAQFIGMHRGSTLQNFLDQVALQLGHSLKLRIQVSSFESVCRMVEVGVGVAVVPQSVALRYQGHGAKPVHLVALQDAWALRPRCMLLREGLQPSAHLQALIQGIQAHYAAAS